MLLVGCLFFSDKMEKKYFEYCYMQLETKQ